MSSTLGVSTLLYLPFAFFNIFSPFLSVLYGFTGFKVEKTALEGDVAVHDGPEHQ